VPPPPPHPDPDQRTAWRWLGAGAALFCVGQLVWTYYALVRRAEPPYPSLADVGYLGLYGCFLVAFVQLVRTQPRRPQDPELVLDTTLVTLTAGVLAYEFLLKRLFEAAGAVLPLLTSVAWSVAGIAVLWLMLVELLHYTRVPVATAGLVIPGLAVLCLTNVAYAAVSLRGGVRSGGVLAFGWDVGFVLLAIAAVVAPTQSRSEDGRVSAISGDTARLIAVVVGLAGIAAIAIAQALSPAPDAAAALLVAGGVAVVGVRFIHGLRADRRYTGLLENEVASQTRSLMDSLAATAAAERSLRLVMDAVPDAILVVDRDGRVLDANVPAHRMVGGAGDVAGRSVFEFFDPAAAPLVGERMAAAFRGEIQRFEAPVVRPDGARGVSAVLYAPVRERSAIARLLVLARDVTDQKHTEAQMQQAEKLGAMGQLVSGVAHEINNPAAIISGFAQTLLLEELKPEHRETLQIMEDEATRIGRITANLLAFARAGGKQQRTLVDLNDIVRRTFALRAYHLSTLNITVALQLDPGDPKIWADAAELQQLVLNLLINAEQALMTVESSRTITARTRASEDETVFELGDSGPGVPAEIRGRIFDPFFTTKPEGVGTGLGLSICYGIAQQHAGRIWVESEPGQGARFLVAIPRDPRHDARLEVAPQPAAGGRTGELTVLVVDDEAALRNALLRYLERHGIRGQGAADGREALALLAREHFDVIISDVRMPGMSGREFLERLRAERPELATRLVFSTGDTFAADTAALLRDAGVPTLTKPFDFKTLERVIREVAARVADARPQASA
jgi:PAS domain S-box-containing protein